MDDRAGNELFSLSAGRLLEAYARRLVSPVEVIDALAARIEEHDERLGAFTTLCLERGRQEAVLAEAAYRSGGAGPLGGVPIGVKDLFDSAGVRTTYGSPMFAAHVPRADAAALRRAREAGAILIGKTQTHEFAWGITSVNPRMGTSRNPWDPDRISGGSSGGSAVALAARLVPLALGSDTGGSIRMPSAFCGTVGLKPTYGRVSAAGVFPLARSLDHPGPMARTPDDAALLLDVIADAAAGGRAETGAGEGLTGVRLGVCPDLHLAPLDPSIQRAFDATLETSRRLGAKLVEVALPQGRRAYEIFGVIQRAEALLTHTQAGLFPDRRSEYGQDVGGRLELSTGVQLADYMAATLEREQLRAAFHRLFSQVELLLTPVNAGSPPRIGQDRVLHLGQELDFRELVMGFTVPQDLVGLPACTVRAGFDDLGLPVGVQLTGAPWRERRVLSGAQALFDATAELQAIWPELPGAGGGQRGAAAVARDQPSRAPGAGAVRDPP